MAVAVANFGLVTVSTPYSSSSTSIVLQSGHGSRLPSTFPFPLTWWDATLYAQASDDPAKEIVLVTNRVADTLTVTRGQEGTSASAKSTGGSTYRMSLGITKAMWETTQRPKSFVQGLQLRTSRHTDLAGTTVEVAGVDSIIMDDGTELRNDNNEWTGKTASSAVSGAGGLDGGTVEALTFYEIYAIAKEDGTRALLLHRSKQWGLETGYLGGPGEDRDIRSSSSTTVVSQGFQLDQSGVVPFVEVRMRKVGVPTGNIFFAIETNASGAPSGVPLMLTARYDVARLTTEYAWIRFPITLPVTLSSSTQYWLSAYGSWTISGSNYVRWASHLSGATYDGGNAAIYNGSSWTSVAGEDLFFNVGLEVNGSSIAMPSGYTKKCFLGWAQTNASSAFRPFVQVHRTHLHNPISEASNSISTLGGARQLVDLSTVLPPRPLIHARVALTGTGTGAAVAAVGLLNATDLDPAGTSTGALAVLHAGATTQRPSDSATIPVEMTALMVNGTANAKIWITGFEW